jgi:hypothetical protein
MKERAKLVAGELFLDSAPNKGTRVVARVPSEPQSKAPVPQVLRASAD